MALRAIQAHGTTDVPLPAGPPFFRFSDPEECRRALAAVGFTDVRSDTLPLVWRFPDAEAVFVAIRQGTVRTAALVRAQTPEALAAIGEAGCTEAATYATGSGVEVPMGAVLTAAPTPESGDRKT
jgi:hypothetical protein